MWTGTSITKYDRMARKHAAGGYNQYHKPKPRYVTKKYVDKKIKGIIEKKYHLKLVSSGANPSYDNPYQVSLSEIALGSGDIFRDGDRIKVTSIQISGSIAAGINTNFAGVRILVFQWLCESVPVPLDIISASGIALTSLTWQQNHYNHDKRNQFRILSDRKYTLGGTTTGNGLETEKRYKRFEIKLNIGLLAKQNKVKNFVQYIGGSTTVMINNIYFLAIGSDVDASGLEGNVTFESKLNFLDA